MAKTKSSAKSSKATAAKKKVAAKPAVKAARKAPAPAAKPPVAKPQAADKPKPVAKTETHGDATTDWSSAIKKALQEKGGQPHQWPGSGDAWKRKKQI